MTQDDADRSAAEELNRGLNALYLEVAPSIAKDIRIMADAAIREAEQRGMMRALAAIAPMPGGAVTVPDDLDVISYARGHAHGTADAAQAIERAATEAKEPGDAD